MLHIVPPTLNSTEVEYSILDRYKVVDDKMISILRNSIVSELGFDTIPDRINIQIKKGEVVSQIKKHISSHTYDAIVMGTRDKYDLLDKVIGTVSLAIVKTSDCPLYLIPRYANYRKYNRVMVAADKHLLNNKVGLRIKEWNKDYNAFVTFMHVSNGKDNYVKSEDILVSELFENGDPSFGFEVTTVQGAKVGKTLLDTAYNIGADLLISMPDKQNFLSALLYKSVTKELIHKSSIPLLFIHPLEPII